MASAGRVLGTSCLVLVMVTGAYVTADVYDMVPGLLTTRAADPEPDPFPQAPGARPAPEQVPNASNSVVSTQAITDLEPVERALTTYLDKEEWIGPSVGIYVIDATTSQEIIKHNAGSRLEPASTAKILTAVAALERLGPQTTLKTTVIRDGDDNLFLVGGGDSLLSVGASDPYAVIGRAGLGDLADQVAEDLLSDGVTETRLNLDDTLFEGPFVHTGWPENTLNQGWEAPVTPIAIEGGRIGEGAYASRQPDPSIEAARAFAAALQERGVSVTGNVRRATTESTNVIAQIESAPVSEIVDYFMRTSDNTVTDVMCRLVAVDAGFPATFDGGTSAVLNTVGQLGVNTRDARLSDCSGLAEGSLLTPELLVDVIRTVHDSNRYQLSSALTGMPVAGVSGTLESRFEEGHATGLIRAKTGSLPETSSLAGSLLTIDGQELLFAVMMDDIPEGESWSGRASMDILLQSLVACGCSGED